MKIIFATNNIHKLKEIKEILGEKYKDFIFCLKDLGISIDPEENGKDYTENSDIKSKAAYDELLNKKILNDDDFVVADDTGLSIDYLDGAPGIRSARFMGKETLQEEKNAKILELMKEVPDEKRTAHFTTVLSVRTKKFNEPLHFEGKVYGYIARTADIGSGFGYDPIFAIGNPKDIAKNQVKTYSKLGVSGKNAISHRKLALSQFVQYLEKYHNI